MKHYQDTHFLKQYPLSSKKPLKKTLSSMFLPSPLLVILLIFAFYGSVLWRAMLEYQHNFSKLQIFLILLSAFIVSFIIVYIYQYLYYKTYFYNLTNDHIIIFKGVIAPKEITIPYEKIQDIYVDQDILDRLFGLYDVHISTPTASSGQAAHIDGVEKTIAEELRALLLQKVKEHPVYFSQK